MDEGYRWLKRVADQMNSDVAQGAAPAPERLTVRDLLWKFGYQRRGDWINIHIRNGLEKFKLRVDHDFTIAWLDSQITIELDSDAPGTHRSPHQSDPTHRVGALEAANRAPAAVKPEDRLREATTKMQMNGYSRLPVMRNEREVAGVVTWELIGTRLSLGLECNHVKQCMEPAEVIPYQARLFDAVRRIAEHGYVLVQARDRTITGIVTATDLSHHFGQLAAPFLFVGEIEGHLRNLIHGKFTLDQLQAAAERVESIGGSADLSFGEYCRLLENRENWGQLKLDIDRAEFVKNLHAVRKIRNAVMHFNPDGLDDKQWKTLRSVARFFDKLARMTAA